MSQKLDRLAEELEKAKKKQEEINLKVEDLQRRYTETENTEIQSIVRSASISVDDLKALLDARSRGINPVLEQTLSLPANGRDASLSGRENPDCTADQEGNGKADDRDGFADTGGDAEVGGTADYKYENEGDDDTDEADEN